MVWTFVGEGEKQMDGRSLQQYRFYVPEKLSHYRVQAAGSMRVAPYEGRFWLDPASGELARLTVRIGELSRSTGTCEATTTVDFARSHIGAGEYLLPRKSLLPDPKVAVTMTTPETRIIRWREPPRSYSYASDCAP
jgi:hypothetical protein